MCPMKRSIVAAATVALVLAALAPQAQGGDPAELLPNLQVRRAPFVTIEMDGGVRKLRFNTEVANRGNGPLELQALNEECAGDPARYVTFQRLFHDGGEQDGIFDRTEDTSFTQKNDVGCIIFHPKHDHWHFEDFARYELFKIRADGKLRKEAVADSDKVSFCMTDSASLGEPIPGTPTSSYYKAIPQGCQQDEGDGTFPPMGISVGWYDLYGYTLPGQALRITDLPDGPYCLRIRLDPTDRLREFKERDNGRRTRLRIDGGSVDVRDEIPCKSE